MSASDEDPFSPSSPSTRFTERELTLIVPNLADAALLRRGRHAKARAGGALGLQMNIFERVSRVVRSYVNAAITAAEDPEK